MQFRQIHITQYLIGLYFNIFPENIPHQTIDIQSDTYTNEKLKVMNGVFKDNAKWYGIFDNSKLVAFCTLGTLPDGRTILYNVGVHPHHRRQGYATSLMHKIIELYSHSDIYLFVAKNNRSALGLYRKFHFEFVERAFQPPEGEVCLCRTSVPSD
jgi:ribosomal protein S18 acetylase RimI-like enzyme